MASREPVAELDPRFSSDDATPTPWEEGREHLERAEVYWLSTVRPDGSPHVTPLLAVLLDGAMFFCTGPDERKARNLSGNPRCALVTGRNALEEGLDLVVEGSAERLTDDAGLRRVADAYLSKYGEGWRFAARDGAFFHDRDLSGGRTRARPGCTRSARRGCSASARAGRSARPAGGSSRRHRPASAAQSKGIVTANLKGRHR